MGHWEHEWEDYNPSTDRYTYGPRKYVLDEKDREETYEKRRKESESKTISAYIRDIKSSSDYEQIREAEQAIDKSEYLSSSEKVSWRRELAQHIRSLRRYEDMKVQSEIDRSKRNRESRKEKYSAFEEATKRYKSRSIFWRLTHQNQRPSKIDYDTMTVDQINGLYKKR